MLEILLEEPSAELLIQTLAPVIVPGVKEGEDFETRVFQGKDALLRKLPQRLAGYGSWAEMGNVRILVLVDRDDDSCVELKRRMVEIVQEIKGLHYHSGVESGVGGSVKISIACEEIEAWMIGDPDALRSAFPKLPKAFEKKAAFRNPDDIKGGTWEKLEKLLQDHGYFAGGLRKRELARVVGRFMDPDRNSSESFGHFCRALRALM